MGVLHKNVKEYRLGVGSVRCWRWKATSELSCSYFIHYFSFAFLQTSSSTRRFECTQSFSTEGSRHKTNSTSISYSFFSALHSWLRTSTNLFSGLLSARRVGPTEMIYSIRPAHISDLGAPCHLGDHRVPIRRGQECLRQIESKRAPSQRYAIIRTYVNNTDRHVFRFCPNNSR